MTEKFVDMKSPFTGGKVKEVTTTESKRFRNETYEVKVRYYVCVDTGEQFTTTEQDTIQFHDLYSQYRLRHGLPFPDEMKRLRTRYGLNHSQIAHILGLAANQYARYEEGEVSSEENGKKIAAQRDNQALLELLRKYKDDFSSQEYQRILLTISLQDTHTNSFTPAPSR